LGCVLFGCVGVFALGRGVDPVGVTGTSFNWGWAAVSTTVAKSRAESAAAIESAAACSASLPLHAANATRITAGTTARK
jgi:hypothetical protein